MAEAGSHIQPPAALNVSDQPIDNWKLFKQSWQNYSIITKLNDKDEPFKIAMFLHCIGIDALKIYNTLTFSDEEHTLLRIIEKMEKYFIGDVNETYERYVFNQRSQKEGETVDHYITSLKTLSKSCNFCDCLADSLLRDRIVLGIRSSTAKKRLLQERNLDLKKCIDICKSQEASEAQLRAMGSETIHTTTTTHKLKQGKTKNSYVHDNRKLKISSPTSTPFSNRCKFCTKSHPLKKEACPAWGKTCNLCKRKNHFAAKCTFYSSTKVHEFHTTTDSDSEDNLLTLSACKSKERKAIFINLLIDGSPIKFQIDSGATTNVLPIDKLSSSDKRRMAPDSTKLLTYNNDVIRSSGKITKSVLNPKTGKNHMVDFLIVDSKRIPIIGKLSSEKLGILKVNYRDFEHVNRVSTSANDIIEQYSDVFSKELGRFSKTVHLMTDPSVTPVNSKAARIPVTLKTAVKLELGKMVNQGIISPVSQPTDWCSRMVTATKKNGELRICIDPRELNKALKREQFQIPIMEDILPELSKAKVFTKIDVKSAYWHCKLDYASSILTTFDTPFGRFKWNRLPFGLTTSGETFVRCLHEALQGLPGVFCAIDDIIVTGCGDTHDEAVTNHNENLSNLLTRCRAQNIALNKAKLELCRNDINFLGHKVTSSGLKPDPDKVKAVTQMTEPVDAKGVQRLCGFINYLAKFLPNLSQVIEPIRLLVRANVNFHWGKAQADAFEKIKYMVTTAPVLVFYSPEKDLVIQCDASEKGIGAALLQNSQPIAYASRALSDTEKRYAQIEKEMLAVVFSLERFHQYTFGRKITVHSDHKPLEAILKKPLSSVPRRLQGMILRCQRYDINLIYKKGSEMYLADTLSRASLPTTDGQDEFELVNVFTALPIRTDRLAMLQSATLQDEHLQQIVTFITNSWPTDKSDLPPWAMPFFYNRHELSYHDNLVFRNEQVIVPRSMRTHMLEALHASHRSADACLRRARECLYWPTMSADIRQYISNCNTCHKFLAQNQKETLKQHDLGSFPWEKVGIDLFAFGNNVYLVTVDYFSNYFEVDKLESMTSACVIKKLKYHFARYGIPLTVISDNGPQFISYEFKQFASSYDFKHKTSSPYHSQSNGMAENAVKQAKTILRKCSDSKTDPFLALIECRNTPDQHTNTSPAQRFLGRRTRSLVPATRKLLMPNYHSNDRSDTSARSRQKLYYDKQAKDLQPLQSGDQVMVQPTSTSQKEWKPGVILQRQGRSYDIQTSSGNLRRNRIHLRPKHHSLPGTGTIEAEAEPEHQTSPSADETPLRSEPGNEKTPLSPRTQSSTSRIPLPLEPRTTRSGRIVKAPVRFQPD